MTRTGLSEAFDAWGEYQRHLNIVIAAGLVEDASKQEALVAVVDFLIEETLAGIA